MLIGTYSESGLSHVKSTVAGCGVEKMTLDLESGQLTSKGVVHGMQNPTWLTYSQTSGTVYAAGEIENGRVYAFASADESNALSSALTKGKGCVHCALSPSGTVLAVANYWSGDVAIFDVAKDGRIDESACEKLLTHEEFVCDLGLSGAEPLSCGAVPGEQDGPRAHQVVFHSKWMHVVDKGCDCIKIYETDTLVPCGAVRLSPGSGPRHITFHTSLATAYVVGEIDCSVTVLCGRRKVHGTVLQRISTLSYGKDSSTSAAAHIALHPSGRMLYVSNRGDNTIVAFKVSETGTLSSAGTSTQVQRAASFDVTPDGGWLIVANQDSNTVDTHRVEDVQTGLLRTGRASRFVRCMSDRPRV